MHRNEPAVVERPAENELLRKLDESLRERAKKIAADALNGVQDSVVEAIAKALDQLVDNGFRAEIVRRVDNAFDILGREVSDIAYRRLVERVTTQLTDGKAVDLT